MEKKIRYKVLSGTHRIEGKRFGKDDIFSEYPHKVEWMKHRVQLVDEAEEVVDEEKREKIVFVKKHKGAGRYVVVKEGTEDPIHEGTLKKDKADELIQKMVTGSGIVEAETKEDSEDDEWDDEDK